MHTGNDFTERFEPVPHPAASWPEAEAFEAALLVGDHLGSMAVMTQCLDAGRGLVQVEGHVIQPALYSIGARWQANQVSVAQEHLATAIAQSVMTVGLLRSTPAPRLNTRALLACAEGNHHDVGLRMVTDAFILAGWDVQYLGANVPTAALVQQAADWRPALVGLSVSFPHQLPAVKAAITQLEERFEDGRPAVIVGGLAFNRVDGLASLAGADAWASDATEAVAQASRLVGVETQSREQ